MDMEQIQVKVQSKEITDPDTIKSCCSRFYENDLVAKILGENFHPGGEKLTIHLGEKLGLNEHSIVLDVACGTGESAITIAKHFGCHVTGIDLGEKNLAKATEKAADEGLTDKLEFLRSDAERLEFDDEQFDAVICECALCTFPDHNSAVNEMVRVLKPGGKVGITDMTLKKELPDNLKNILFQVVCISGAKQAEEYMRLLENAGFTGLLSEDHSYTLKEILDKVDKVVQGWEFIDKLSCCDLEKILGITLTSEKARELLDQGYEELENGNIGYGLFIGKC